MPQNVTYFTAKLTQLMMKLAVQLPKELTTLVVESNLCKL